MTPDKYLGRLILFEGPEGGGKSTLIKAIAERLRVNLGLSVVETKEPGHNTELGKRVRERLLHDKSLTNEQELALFINGRADHFEHIVIPALKAGKIVLCDRASPSTEAYQHYGRGMDKTDILVLDAEARRNVNFDLIILLDIDPVIGLARKNRDNRFEQEKLEFHQKVRAGYLDMAMTDVEKKWVVIDASQPLETVQALAWNAIYDFLLKSIDTITR